MEFRFAVVILTLVGTAAADPPRRKVHVDHLDPAKVGQYEHARFTWVKWLAEHHAADPWGGTFLQVGGSTFLTVRAFTNWAELDSAPTAKLDPKVQAAYNDESDAALVPPHHDEVWIREPELDLGAGDVVGYGRIDFDDVKLDDDGKAWSDVRAELVAAKYPLARIGFFSRVGSGKQISLWLAPTKAAFAKAPSIDAVLEQRLGKDRASALLVRWRGQTLHHEQQELIVRADLSD
jgi:hypothetical protein